MKLLTVSSTYSMVNLGHGYWGFIVIREPYHAELRSYFQMLGEV
ncbi:P44-38 outer membrane, silent domain protein [Anaplasma phagocytophilum]|nr:P44-38 outer membrane, silent domain protein [Anaplasma phagocytophilum]